ncbi:MAG: flavin reductase (DIM6/NTAB) family NADH-FMN oxidoreductase RutF [Psychromonas sp.]|jgi:flavin reductase (DIM6/NTAB) family NADH-FMN oxidoreductase RutF
MDNRYRAKFINSLSGFKSVNLIGTQDSDGQTNLAIFSSVVHLGASPALVAFVMRPDNGSRHTLDNIISTGHYTINQVSAQFYQAAHQSSAGYPKEESEFTHLALSETYISNIKAPFVKQSRLKYAVKLKEIMPISSNNTQFIIGEIVHVICDDSVLKDDGYIDIEALETVTVSGLDSYHKSIRLARLSYAKPDKSSTEISLNGSVNFTDDTRSKS